MEQEKAIKRSNINYWINFSSFIPFILLAITGIILQFNYHFGHKPDNFEVLSLTRPEWLLWHKIFAIISTPVIIFHLILHTKWIKNLIKNRFSSKGNKIIRTTKILLILYVLAVITGVIPWLFIEDQHQKRMFVELHDKITLGIIFFFVLHFIQHFKWIVKNTKNIFFSKGLPVFILRISHLSHNHLKTKFVRLNNRICQACWKCVEKCPQKVIGKINLTNHKHAHIDNSEKCIGCFKCVTACEFNALKKIIV